MLQTTYSRSTGVGQGLLVALLCLAAASPLAADEHIEASGRLSLDVGFGLSGGAFVLDALDASDPQALNVALARELLSLRYDIGINTRYRLWGPFSAGLRSGVRFGRASKDLGAHLHVRRAVLRERWSEALRAWC